MAKFELSELKKLHEELSFALAAVRKDNNAIVEPVLEGLRKEVGTSKSYGLPIIIIFSINNYISNNII